jgi:hypothetical protein
MRQGKGLAYDGCGGFQGGNLQLPGLLTLFDTEAVAVCRTAFSIGGTAYLGLFINTT